MKISNNSWLSNVYRINFIGLTLNEELQVIYSYWETENLFFPDMKSSDCLSNTK